MSDETEQAWMDGRRAAWVNMLGTCLRMLDYESLEVQQVKWIIEREEMIAKLREIGAMVGHTDWQPDAHLPDVLERIGDAISEVTEEDDT